MFVRIWQYVVRSDQVDTFAMAYGAGGEWAELFARGTDYLGTELYRDTGEPERFLTVDRWIARAGWQRFLQTWDASYAVLDAQLSHLTVSQHLLAETEIGGG